MNGNILLFRIIEEMEDLLFISAFFESIRSGKYKQGFPHKGKPFIS